MNKTTIYWVVGFVVVAITGVIIAAAMGTSGSGVAFVATTAPAIGPLDQIKGNKDAKVSVIEYGDFECPACGSYSPIYDQLIKKYGDKALFAFRNFPLTTIHMDAEAAAEAAEAAGLQEKYWEMHDALYAQQLSWTLLPFGIGLQSYFDKLASSLGLNVAQFDRDMNSQEVRAKIDHDVQSANAAQVDHTPTFFVNLKQIPNPANYDEFSKVIEDAIAASK